MKVNRLLLNNIDVVGVGWGAWAATHPGALAEQWAGLERLLSSGQLPPPEPVVYPLERGRRRGRIAGEPHRQRESRAARPRWMPPVLAACSHSLNSEGLDRLPASSDNRACRIASAELSL